MFKLLKKLRDLLLVGIIWRKYKIGNNFHAGRGVTFWAKNNISIGDNFYIGRYSQIECDATIGHNVMLANNVALVGRYDHNYQQIGTPTRLASQIRDENYDWKGLSLKVVIGDDVFIGYGSIILTGVKIGEGSIIAAGSVVTQDVESFWIYGGVPAKKICARFNKPEELNEHKRLYDLNYKKLVNNTLNKLNY
jgi:acetyltransferase-like isoleucine patch superfamily enzyme